MTSPKPHRTLFDPDGPLPPPPDHLAAGLCLLGVTLFALLAALVVHAR